MVSYQRWTSIVFDVARQRGAQFGSIEDGQPVIRLAAEVWKDRKDEIAPVSVAEARDIALEEVEVR